MTTLTRQDYADIAYAAYQDLDINRNDSKLLISIPKGSENKYFVHMKESDPKTGFQGYLLEKAGVGGQHTGEFITAFRGSESGKDWQGNMHALATGHHPQIEVAMVFTDKAQKEAKDFALQRKLPYSMTNVGHSLGGAEAQVAFLVNGSPSVTFNPLPATLLKDADGNPFQFPANAPIQNLVMGLDVASAIAPDALPGETMTYSRTKDRRILKLADYNSDQENDPYAVMVMDAFTKTSHSLEHFVGKNSVLGASRYLVEKDSPTFKMINEWRNDVREEFKDIQKGNTFNNLEKFFIFIDGKYEGNDKKVLEELNRPNPQQEPIPINQNNNIKNKLESKSTESIYISPQAQQLYQQCEEKLIALCKEKNITADNPQDFKNIAMALTAKALEHQMTKVDKMDFGKGDMLYILSNQPHAVLASVAANDVVNIPITESMAKIQQIEQQQTQLAQERQVSQSQSQQHGISLA